jgi:hypothetical protein
MTAGSCALFENAGRNSDMLTDSHYFVRPRRDNERTYLESLVREDDERCHPGDTFEHMKQRASFAVEDKELYREWLAVAAARALPFLPIVRS